MAGPQRPGRRPGETQTRETILAAARASFGERGFTGTTMRGVAADAQVDPALLSYFFGNKAGLFAAAMELPVNPAEVLPRVLAGGEDGLGERLVGFFLDLWHDPAAAQTLRSLLISAASHEAASRMVREFVSTALVGRIAATLDRPDADLRATLVGSQLIGLAMLREVIGIEPLASADRDRLVEAIGPTVQRYLTGPLGGPEDPAADGRLTEPPRRPKG